MGILLNTTRKPKSKKIQVGLPPNERYHFTPLVRHNARISNVEYHGVFVGVDLGGETLDLTHYGVPCIFVHLLDVACTSTCVEVGALL